MVARVTYPAQAACSSKAREGGFPARYSNLSRVRTGLPSGPRLRQLRFTRRLRIRLFLGQALLAQARRLDCVGLQFLSPILGNLGGQLIRSAAALL